MADRRDRAVMAIADVAEAIGWQAEHTARAMAPCTARVIMALRAVLGTDTELARRMRHWSGLTLEDALPLRVAGGLHHLYLSGDAPELGPVYAGAVAGQDQVDAIVTSLVRRFDARLLPWLNGPPQTNEAGRSAGFMAALLWLSPVLGARFELNEIGASAGINTMMERYFYDLGGVRAGPPDSPVRIVPEWRGPPPPSAGVRIEAIRGSDIAPIDLADPEAALRLKAYVWADAAERMARIDAAVALAGTRRPDLAARDAGDFVREMLAMPQQAGVTRVLCHSVVWQYLPAPTRESIRGAMERAGRLATADRPLAWVRLETNRQTYAHELTVKYWPGGAEEWIGLATAHPHGAWVEWLGVSPRCGSAAAGAGG